MGRVSHQGSFNAEFLSLSAIDSSVQSVYVKEWKRSSLISRDTAAADRWVMTCVPLSFLKWQRGVWDLKQQSTFQWWSCSEYINQCWNDDPPFISLAKMACQLLECEHVLPVSVWYCNLNVFELGPVYQTTDSWKLLFSVLLTHFFLNINGHDKHNYLIASWVCVYSTWFWSESEYLPGHHYSITGHKGRLPVQ